MRKFAAVATRAIHSILESSSCSRKMNFSKAVCRLKPYHRPSAEPSFSHLRHRLLVNFPDRFHHIFTNTRTHSPLVVRSVFVVSPAAPHTKKFSCLIDREFFSGFACHPPHKNCHKCSGTLQSPSDCISYRKSQARTMVWITDLDNPQVLTRPTTVGKQIHLRFECIAGGKIHNRFDLGSR